MYKLSTLSPGYSTVDKREVDTDGHRNTDRRREGMRPTWTTSYDAVSTSSVALLCYHVRKAQES